MKAYILVKIRVGEVNEVVRPLRRIDGIVEANMTFGPYDAAAVLDGSDIASIGNLIATAIQPIPGFDQTLPCLAMEI